MCAATVSGLVLLAPSGALAQGEAPEVIIDVCGPSIIEQYEDGVSDSQYPDDCFSDDAPVGGEVTLDSISSATPDAIPSEMQPAGFSETVAPYTAVEPSESGSEIVDGATGAYTPETGSVAEASGLTVLPDTGGYGVLVAVAGAALVASGLLVRMSRP